MLARSPECQLRNKPLIHDRVGDIVDIKVNGAVQKG